MSTCSTNIEISVLLPTRGRTEALDRSLVSLIDNSTEPKSVEYLLGFDNDDSETFEWFLENIADKINSAESFYTCMGFKRLGYLQLNRYVNELARIAKGRWLFFWNDDAIMQTPGWDAVIRQHTDFSVLRIPTHNHHPYAIFPIVPKEWYELFGYLSPHQISDAWISQVAYMLNIVKNIPVEVVHDRHDLTGNNKDKTFEQRLMYEGNPRHPKDFNHADWRRQRFVDAAKIALYLRNQGRDMTWFERVLNGTQDPWEKMTSLEYDPNQQLGIQK